MAAYKNYRMEADLLLQDPDVALVPGLYERLLAAKNNPSNMIRLASELDNQDKIMFDGERNAE
jgi:hypothetical protein